MSSEFLNVSNKFAETYLYSVEDYNDLLATIVFLKNHPNINEQVLVYAIIQTLLHRSDTSLDVANPIEVNHYAE